MPWHSTERKTHTASFRLDWSIQDPAKCLPLGLAFLHRLVLARTPRERRRILSAQSLSTEAFFYGWGTAIINDRLRLSEMNEEKQRMWINPPTDCDGDGGPEAAWRWAYADHDRASWYDHPRCRHLREWGYVMWDYDRLDSCGVFDMDARSLERQVNPARLVDAMMRCVLGTNVTTFVNCGRG